MTVDLEDRVRAVLRTDAARAPLTTPEWGGLSYVARESPRHRARWLLAAAAAIALAAGGLVIARRPRANDDVRPAFLRGDEVVLTPVDVPPTFQPQGVVKPGTVRAVQRPGSDVVDVVYRSAGWGSPESIESICVVTPVPGGPIACAGTDALVYGWSDGLSPDSNVLTWSRLPARTAYVQLVGNDGGARWQVPVEGVAQAVTGDQPRPRQVEIEQPEYFSAR